MQQLLIYLVVAIASAGSMWFLMRIRGGAAEKPIPETEIQKRFREMQEVAQAFGIIAEIYKLQRDAFNEKKKKGDE